MKDVPYRSGGIGLKIKTQYLNTPYTFKVTDVDDGDNGTFDLTQGEPCMTVTIDTVGDPHPSMECFPN